MGGLSIRNPPSFSTRRFVVSVERRGKKVFSSSVRQVSSASLDSEGTAGSMG